MRSCARPLRLVLVGLPMVAIVLIAACADDAPIDAATTSPDGGVRAEDARADADPAGEDAPTETMHDASPDGDTPLATANEKEPNNGATATETNAMSIPGRMNATIDPANDADIFSVNLAPGELWQWTITPATAEFAPHLAVFDVAPNNLNPNRVVTGTAGKPAMLDHFVLHAGNFLAGVRDERNVPTPTGKGGKTFTYTLQAVKKAIAPVAVTFPSTKTATLASPGALDFYAFTATKGTTFGIVIKAERKAQPSTLDSRLSLFNATTNEAIITNDNASGSRDSQVGGKIPENGSYLAIVEHEGNDASDLSYEIVFQTTEPL